MTTLQRMLCAEADEVLRQRWIDSEHTLARIVADVRQYAPKVLADAHEALRAEMIRRGFLTEVRS